MKNKTTLKDVLKPPFTCDRIGMIYDANSRFIDVPGINSNKENPESWQGEAVAKTRGWGVFQYYENGEELQDAFMEFIVDALNEKWERDFGEPLRWIRLVKAGVNDRNTCPNCKVNRAKATNFCPSCGVRLLPPGEDNGK